MTIQNEQANYFTVKARVTLVNSRLARAGLQISFSFRLQDDVLTIYKTETFAGSESVAEFNQGNVDSCLRDLNTYLIETLLATVEQLRFSVENAQCSHL